MERWMTGRQVQKMGLEVSEEAEQLNTSESFLCKKKFKGMG